MTAHDHSTFVEGCYRCDLSRDEVIGYTPTTEEVRSAATQLMDGQRHAPTTQRRSQQVGSG